MAEFSTGFPRINRTVTCTSRACCWQAFEIDYAPLSRLNNHVLAPPPSRKSTLLIALALGWITLAIYLPSLRHDFLDYDDQQYVTDNPRVRAGLSVEGVGWAFGYHAGNWHPLTWLSHMFDCSLHGLKPAGHHLTNVCYTPPTRCSSSWC